MAILEKEVWINVDGKTSDYYEMCGYKIQKYDNNGVLRVMKGTKILVKIDDLSDGCNVKLTKICDNPKCKKHIPNQTYNTILSKRKKNGGKDYCLNCGRHNAGRTKSLDIEEVYSFILERDLNPIFNSYSNGREKLLCKTKDGYKVVPSYENLKAGKKPRIFSKSNPYTIENIEHFIELNEFGYELLSTEFISAGKDKLLWKCKENHEFLMSWDVFSKGHRCPECNESKGEKQIRRILDSYNVDYVSQYDEFSDLLGIGGFKLRFDFALTNIDNLICLIEYDGKFHYEKQYVDDHFEIIVEHDKRKNEYCLKNNIKLIRIPYWEFDNLEQIIKNILLENNLI